MANQNTLALGGNSATPQTFNFDNLPVRTVERSGEIWFVAADVCKALEISNPRDATGRLDTDEKDDVGITDTIGREQTVNIISESGLYSLILTSRKKEAKRFKKWVTSEVLPAIRKTGSYSVQPEPKKQIEDKKPKYLNSPNYQLASEVAAKAAQAVFEAFMREGDKWLKNQRLLLSMQQANKYRPIVKPISSEAYVASLADLIKMIKGGAFLSRKELADLASACFQRLNQYMD